MWALGECVERLRCRGTLAKVVLTIAGTTVTAWALAADQQSSPDLTARGSEPSATQAHCSDQVTAQLSIDQGHPWRPPFGLDRIGSPAIIHVRVDSAKAPLRDYYVVAQRKSGQSQRQSLALAQEPVRPLYFKTAQKQAPFFANAKLTFLPDEVVLYARCKATERTEELARRNVVWPELEIDATARPDHLVNPVDLGAILVPHDQLLLARGQAVSISVAALSRAPHLSNARLRAWFDGDKPVEVAWPLSPGQRSTKELKVVLRTESKRSLLRVSLMQEDRELWKKEIQTIVVGDVPRWPSFGAVETKLRYDAPISVRDESTGARLPSIDYNTAWDSRFNDVVVFLPNGARFVFWRGSNYIPFWASRYNTGVCYQWAENLSQPVHHADGTVDFPEPLYDRELRYARVQIVESTPSRVHVRWTYQSTDVNYNVWGDLATEDFYFYPDGFGTRSLTLLSAPGAAYQLSEFIVMTPQAAFPLDVLPSHIGDVLFLDGEKKPIVVPSSAPQLQSKGRYLIADNPRRMPVAYRVFSHKEDRAAAIYFSPRDTTLPMAIRPFYDQGEVVAPVYWGNHWPLGRGKITGWTVDEGIRDTPAHNSVAAWIPEGLFPPNEQVAGSGQPAPVFVEETRTIDARGYLRDMATRRWVWMIAMADVSDEALLNWTRSFSDPPSVEVSGARIDLPSYSPERRAVRLIAESSSINVKLKPVSYTINPVFEIEQAASRIERVTMDDKPLPAEAYAWDGATLWIQASIGLEGANIGVFFK
jgi:hypothetical protein